MMFRVFSSSTLMRILVAAILAVIVPYAKTFVNPQFDAYFFEALPKGKQSSGCYLPFWLSYLRVV